MPLIGGPRCPSLGRALKGLSHEIFRPFFACMDASRPEGEPLVVIKFL
jgi:hypothetical protein